MKLIIFFILFLSIFIVFSSNQITFTTNKNNQFLFKLTYGNLKIILQPELSLRSQKSWILSQQCRYCKIIENEQQKQQTEKIKKNTQKNRQTFQNKQYDCTSNVGNNEQQYSIRCTQISKNCQIINQNVIIQSSQENFILQGKQITVKVKNQADHQKYQKLQLILVDRIYQKQQQEEEDNKQIKLFQSENSIGKYQIWEYDAVNVNEHNILAKLQQNKLKIYNDIKSSKLQKILFKADPINISFQSADNTLFLTQIKITQLATINHPQKSSQLIKQFPILPILPTFLSLSTQSLHLPSKYFKILTQFILTSYFSSNKCIIKSKIIQCEKQISLKNLQYIQLTLIINGVSIGFPLKVLLKSCKKKTCQIKIQENQENHIKIGTFILDLFALQLFPFQQQSISNILTFYRLSNQYSEQFYSSFPKLSQHLNIFYWIFSSVFYSTYYILKILFYLAFFSLLINLCYKWRKIIQWGRKILQKVKKNNKKNNQIIGNQQEQEEIEIKDTARLIKRIRINKFNNHNQKIFLEDQENIEEETDTTN